MEFRRNFTQYSSIRTFYSSALEANGYTVECFDNPILCLAALKIRKPDCILTDYEMPLQNGVEFCRNVKLDELTNGIPVILLSNHEDDKRIIEALSAGADDYLPKRTNPEIFLAKIRLMTELKTHREKTIIQERLRTYKATVCSIGHELNNTMSILLPLLESMEKSQDDQDNVAAESAKKLHRNLTRLANNIKALTHQAETEIQFSSYVNSTEMVSLKKVP